MNLIFLAIEFAAVSVALLGTYALRSRLGLGPTIAVVASIQFIQAILGATFYWEFAPGLLLTPGSCVLFAGNLALLLFAFARDGVLPARTILYGILIANTVNIVLNVVIAMHIRTVAPINFLNVPTELFDQSLFASVIGILVLYADQMLALLAFAGLRRSFPKLHVMIPLSVVLVGALAFDTLLYLGVLFSNSPNLESMLISGLISKSLGGLVYGVVWGLWLQGRQSLGESTLSEVLSVLLFREDLATLRQAAVTDGLTGLYNRRSYNLILERVFDKSRLAHEPFALILIDVDRFKQVNDRLGHSTGDRVLTSIAETLRTATRGDDFCFRFGGDEFAVILPRCGRDGAGEVTRRINAFEFSDPFLDLPVTLTIGVAIYPEEGDTPTVLFEVADRRLYQGKAEGRGKIIGVD